MLIDDFLPMYDVTERHQIIVNAKVERVYSSVRELDISHARLTRLLFRLRGIPTSSSITLKDFLEMRFMLLGEKPNEELLLGLVGQFWTPTGKLRRLDAKEYPDFNEQGYAKAAWNFYIKPQREREVTLTTETRVQCLDKESRKRFRIYWGVIGVFSGIVRREILREVKRNAEL